MTEKDTAILEFGSTHVRVVVGRRGQNDTLLIKGIGEINYAGFFRGNFADLDQLGYVVSYCVNAAQAKSGVKIDMLYVGVPSDFSSCVTKSVSVSYSRRTRIGDNEIKELFDQGNDFGDRDGYIITDINPVYYILDDERRLLEPRGMYTTRFGAFLSYMLASASFYEPLKEVLGALGLTYHLMSEQLAKMLYLFDSHQREPYIIMLDVSATTTSVVVGKGEGILSIYNFPIGGMRITDELCGFFEIDDRLAERLKQNVLLSVRHGGKDTYDLDNGDEVLSFPAITVDEIVGESLNSLGHTAAKCLAACEYEYPNYLSYYLCGGGISYIKGAKDRLSRLLQRRIELAVPKQPLMEKPHLSGRLSLLDAAIRHRSRESTSVTLTKFMDYIRSLTKRRK